MTLALEALMQNIESRIGSGASVSINGEEIHAGSVIFQSSYSSDSWTGDVRAFTIDQKTGIVNHGGPEWSFKLRLDSQLSSGGWDSQRRVGTYDGTEGIAFRYGNLSLTQQSQLNQNQVNYLRGDDSLEQDQGVGGFRNRTYRLSDIVHSVPVYHDNYIFVGGNDGMLHVINAVSGLEAFAYVPNLVFPNLHYLTSPGYTHKFYVDKSPYIKDTGSATLMVSGLGRGGKGYFCLDVTEPASNTESNVSSWAKWEYPNAETSQSDIDDLGYSFSRAFIVNSNVGWVVIFGNGYNSLNGHAALFVLDAFTGSLINKIDVGGTCNGLSTPVVIDVDNDYKVDYVYAGDLNGNMWKFDLQGANASNWDVAYKSGSTAKPLFRAKDSYGNAQPITIKPDVMRHCDKTQSGYMVLFGTGQYLGDADFLNTSTQTIYGIWDYGDDEDDSEYLGEFDRGSTPQLSNQPGTVTLLQQTEIYYDQPTGINYILRVLSDNEPIWETVADTAGSNPDPSNAQANHAGWYFDLPIQKERVIRNVIIRDGKLIVVSSIPKSSPCASGGDSILHEMDACSGSRLSEAAFDIDDDGFVDDDDLITVTIDDPDNPGTPIDVLLPPTGITYPTMIYEPIILRDGDRELKYFSTAAGNIIMLKEKAERRGMFYWRELD